MRDDQVLPGTQLAGWLVTIVLAAGGAILYLFPGDTAVLWAWSISPDMTALTMGAGYLAGALFFLRALLHRRWHMMAVAILSADVLSTLMMAATLLHWDRFSHGTWVFWAWVVVYAVTPVLLPVLWVYNRSRDPGTASPPAAASPSAVLVPPAARTFAATVGTAQFAFAVAVFARPELAMAVWPWTLTPLTARALAAFLAFVAATWASFAVEARWSAHRLHVEATTVGLLLVALGALRAPADLAASPGGAKVFAVLLTGALAALVSLQVVMRRRISQAEARNGTAWAVPPAGGS